MSATNQTPAITRDPALDRLDKFVGDWAMEGNFAGSDKKDIKGTARFEWLPGGFFLKQHIQLDFAGMVQIDSTEIIAQTADGDVHLTRLLEHVPAATAVHLEGQRQQRQDHRVPRSDGRHVLRRVRRRWQPFRRVVAPE